MYIYEVACPHRFCFLFQRHVPADINGFTRWSSSRSPVEVFQLLENIYGTFDTIAKRRKVFKVETIGDCYLAVTGMWTLVVAFLAAHVAFYMLTSYTRDCDAS